MTAPVQTTPQAPQAQAIKPKPTPSALGPTNQTPGALSAGNQSPYANLTPTSAGGNLLGQTITPGAVTDPVSIAQQSFQTFAQQSDPYYQKALRDATAAGAAKGQLGSGQLRTSYGDLANQRNLQLQGEEQSLLQNALTQANANAYQNVGVAQQQQQFQAQQQQAAYNQALQNAQQALNAQLGLGTLGVQQGALTGTYGGQQTLGAQQLAQQGSQFGQSLGLQQQAQNLAQQLGLGNLSLGQQSLAQQGTQFGQSLAAQQAQNAAQNQLAQQQLALNSQLGLGNLGVQQGQLSLAQQGQAEQYGLQQAAQALNEKVATGQLSIAQAQQQLAELQNRQNYGLAQGGLTGTYNGQQTLAAQQLGSQTALGQQNILVQLANALGLPADSPQAAAIYRQIFGSLVKPPTVTTPTIMTPTITNDPGANQ